MLLYECVRQVFMSCHICSRTFHTVEMAVFSSIRMRLITRQVSMSWKQLAARHSFITVFGQSRKFVRQTVPVNQDCSLLRYISMSSPLRDVEPLASKAKSTGDEPSPAEVLANLSPEDEKRWKVLKLEYDVFMSTGVCVPDQVDDEDWVHLLLNCPTPRNREHYYRYLFKREKAREKDRRTRTANRLAREEKMKIIEQKKLEGTHQFMNTISLRVLESTMNSGYNNNLCYALMNGPHLVFDFSFEDEMNEQELTNLVRQVRSPGAIATVCCWSHMCY